MTSRRRAAMSTLAGSTVTTLLVGVQALVLIPLYLSTIGSRMYGAWLGSGDVLVWMQAFDLGLPNLITQRVGAAHARGDEEAVSGYFASGMLVMFGIAVVLGSLAVALSQVVPLALGLSGPEARVLSQCFAWAAVGSAANVVSNGVVGFSRGVQRTGFLSAMAVVAPALGFIVSLYLVVRGEGLWAISLGLLTRSAVILMGALVFVGAFFKKRLRQALRPRRSMLVELAGQMPATGLGGAAYVIMAQSESFIAATFLSPEFAAVLGVTRKLLELGKGVVDTIAFAVYGGIAHLSGSAEKHRVTAAISEVASIRTSLALAGAAAFMAVNRSLVERWVGPALFGGALLTILLAASFVVTGGAFFANYVYRATGPVTKGSIALAAEALLRVPLAVGLVVVMGLPGIPVAGIVTGSVFTLLAYRWLATTVSSYSEPFRPTPRRVLVARGTVFAVGAALSFVPWHSWGSILAVGTSVALAAALVLLTTDPLLAPWLVRARALVGSLGSPRIG